MLSSFWISIIAPNLWRYVVVIAACFIYAFGLSITGPKWYRAEATLAFKNRDASEQLDLTRLSRNPLPLFLEEKPVEEYYDLSVLVYSVNVANRVIGERFDEIYDPAEDGPLSEFYDDFLLQLGYDYDGEENTLELAYTFTDPELATEFCNGFAASLEEFLIEVVERGQISPILRARLADAREEARVAEEEVNRIAETYGVPDILFAPKEWIKTYAEALERSYVSEARMLSILAALRQVRDNRRNRNLLQQPASPPDTTIMRDLVLAGLRFRLAMLNALIGVSEESLAPETTAGDRLRAESAALTAHLESQYALGLDVESSTLLLQLQEHIVQNYLYEARAEATYQRLEQLPRLEAEIRPAIRTANAANATVHTLQRFSSFTEVGEEYGVHPIRVIDSAIVPLRPLEPAWNTLMYLVPTVLFLSTLLFALNARLINEQSRNLPDAPLPTEEEE